jgi:hypothetical protein
MLGAAQRVLWLLEVQTIARGCARAGWPGRISLYAQSEWEGVGKRTKGERDVGKERKEEKERGRNAPIQAP